MSDPTPRDPPPVTVKIPQWLACELDTIKTRSETSRWQVIARLTQPFFVVGGPDRPQAEARATADWRSRREVSARPR